VEDKEFNGTLNMKRLPCDSPQDEDVLVKVNEVSIVNTSDTTCELKK